MSAERNRIEFLIERDGPEATRDWIKRTLQLYRDALANPRHHASTTHYRPVFEQAVRMYEQWLLEQDSPAIHG